MKLLDYIRGSRKRKEARRLEKEAMPDPFLTDAMDGYDEVGENQEENIRMLRQKVTARAARKRNLTIVWSAAAGVLIILSVGGYFLLNKQPLSVGAQPAFKEIVSAAFQEEEMSALREEALLEDSMEPGQSLITENRSSAGKNAKASIPETILQEVYDEANKEIEFDDTMIAAAPVANMKNPAVPEIHRNKVAGSSSAVKGIRGKVVDKEGEPIIGATIAIKGTHKGTLSDLEGNFFLEPLGDKELEVSFIGYERVVVPADTAKDMLIAMNEDGLIMSEVAVTKRPSRLHRIGSAIVSALKLSGAPQPENGNKAFRQYIKENLVHPTDDSCTHVKGKVVLVFQVGSDGRPDSIRVKKSLCPSADEEAIRLIEEGPDWTVGDKEAKVTIKF